MYQKQNQKSNLKINPLDNSTVGWNASNLFYIFLNELDMDYRDAYYIDDWNKMYKVVKLKYMKVRSYIINMATDEDERKLNDDKEIMKILTTFKDGETDYSNKWNNNIVQSILTIIEEKMRIIDELMSKSGMNLLVNKIRPDLPASLGNDDFVFGEDGKTDIS